MDLIDFSGAAAVYLKRAGGDQHHVERPAQQR